MFINPGNPPNQPGGMPACALPQSFRKGKLSYTISSTNTKARIEVLLKQRAFRIVKIGEKDGCYGQEQNGFKGFVLPLKVLGESAIYQ